VLPGRVLRVIDGYTLDVRLSSGQIRVRLHGIDAPERNQSGGAESTRWLHAVLQDADVNLEPVSQDQYDRLVAIVHLEGTNINESLVRAGHAWAYRRYLRRTDRGWCDLEHAAREARVGLWAAGAPHAPWEFRATRGRGPFTDHSGSNAGDCRRAASSR
jgi:endonuclease YncB( thermonuclease family)